MKNKRSIIVLCLASILLFGVIAGTLAAVLNRDNESYETQTDKTDDGMGEQTTDDNRFEHIVGEPVIEFDEGAEVFLDQSIIPYLERMENGVPATDENGNYYFDSDGDIVYDMSEEKNLEWVLDNLITLINHFAKEQYSMDASHQIQRFYVMYYDRLTELSYEELIKKITECFPTGGADAETLGDTVLNVFGISSGDKCAFVFSPISVAEIKVEFYNVAPKNVTLTNEAEALCIYDNWRNEEDEGYERNLEGWLHNVIFVAQENGFNDEKSIVAQILYAGSLANAEYRADWKDALIKCFAVTEWTYDSFKQAVETEFSVSIDYNVPIQEYFSSIENEVIE